MDPITHTLASLTLSRVGLNRATRWATPMLIAAGLAADLDWLARVAGPRAYLQANRTATHSLLGTVGIGVAIAAVFWWLGRKSPATPVRFSRALLVCAAGAAAHLLLDLTNPYGVKLLWPFSQKWFAWDLVDHVDPWLMFLLLLGLLLPGLFRLVHEEIGSRPQKDNPRRGAIAALTLVAIFVFVRWQLHDRAMEMLQSRLWRGQSPTMAAAFPSPGSPLTWDGIVETDNSIQTLEVSLMPGSLFDPDLAHVYFKPEATPALDAARKSELAEKFLEFARFPRATIEKTMEGYRVTLRDLRFSSLLPSRRGFEAVIEMTDRYELTAQTLRFGTGGRR